jgi:hypothetical protein
MVDKPICAYCGRVIEGSNFLGCCSQTCWKNSQKNEAKQNSYKDNGFKKRKSAQPNREQIIIENTQPEEAHKLVLQKLEEFAVVGVSEVVLIHPDSIKENIRSPEFRKQIGQLGLKFRMESSANDKETLITHLSF